MRFGPPRATVHPEYPFWRLIKDQIWEIPGADRISQTSSGCAHIGSLKKEDAHGGFLEDIYDQFRANQGLAMEIALDLVDAHFQEHQQYDILQAVNIEPEFIITRRKIRDPSFPKKVLSAYGHQCAVCFFAIRLGDKPIGLDAAHIRWHRAAGPDEIRNALALCTLHHRLFDDGAFTLTRELRVEMSAIATGKGYQDALGRFDSKPIVLLPNEDDWPDRRFLDWHRKNVFKSHL